MAGARTSVRRNARKGRLVGANPRHRQRTRSCGMNPALLSAAAAPTSSWSWCGGSRSPSTATRTGFQFRNGRACSSSSARQSSTRPRRASSTGASSLRTFLPALARCVCTSFGDGERRLATEYREHGSKHDLANYPRVAVGERYTAAPVTQLVSRWIIRSRMAPLLGGKALVPHLPQVLLRLFRFQTGFLLHSAQRLAWVQPLSAGGLGRVRWARRPESRMRLAPAWWGVHCGG